MKFDNEDELRPFSPEEYASQVLVMQERVRKLDPDARRRLLAVFDNGVDLRELDKLERAYAKFFAICDPENAVALRSQFISRLMNERDQLVDIIRRTIELAEHEEV